MMFLLDTAFAVESIALALGAFLLAWMRKAEMKCRFCKFVGSFVIVVSFLGMLCTLYYGLKYRSWGLFDDPHLVMKVHGGGMGGMKGMGGMGGMEMMQDKCPMMDKTMRPEAETQPEGKGGGAHDHGEHR